MAVATVVERAQAARAEVVRSRRVRQVTIADAQRVRRRSRELKALTNAAQESALQRHWQFWAAQIVTEVPSYLPASWEEGPDEDEQVLRAAARACDEVVAAVNLVLAVEPDQESREVLVLAAALGEVAAGRVRTDPQEAWIAVAATARLLEQLDETVGVPGGFPDHAVLVVACRSALRTLRRALAHFHEEIDL